MAAVATWQPPAAEAELLRLVGALGDDALSRLAAQVEHVWPILDQPAAMLQQALRAASPLVPVDARPDAIDAGEFVARLATGFATHHPGEIRVGAFAFLHALVDIVRASGGDRSVQALLVALDGGPR